MEAGKKGESRVGEFHGQAKPNFISDSRVDQKGLEGGSNWTLGGLADISLCMAKGSQPAQLPSGIAHKPPVQRAVDLKS